ncbi:MAG TPA: DUF2917 domain-containing protein [Holophaga sp.]|nr:DUF2917 domain-containing protein [Holophaga sp.]
MNHATVMHNDLPMAESSHFTPRYGCLSKDGVKAFTALGGERVHCNEGRLWVTFEGDNNDHILAPGQSLEIPNGGKTLISGPGCYRISHSIDGLDIVAAA